jgi:hypothetical protein
LAALDVFLILLGGKKMKHFKLKLIISILTFIMGVTCFYLWNLHRLNSKPKADNKAQAQTVTQSEVAIQTPTKSDAISVAPSGPIGKLDFRNFTYPNIESKGSIKVKNGELEYEVGHCNQHYRIEGVDYLDFTGDGQDEAVVSMVDHQACGSSSTSVFFYVYEVRNGRPRLLWALATGSESYGGEKDFRIEGKELVFELYGKWETVGGKLRFKENREHATDCCPTHYTVYRVAWDSNKFRQKSVEVLPFTDNSIY